MCWYFLPNESKMKKRNILSGNGKLIITGSEFTKFPLFRKEEERMMAFDLAHFCTSIGVVEFFFSSLVFW